MTNYIIAPQVFYWINVLGILQTVFGIFGGLFITAFIILAVSWVYNATQAKEYYSYKKYIKVCKKWAIITGILGSIMIIASIFIPGRTSSIEMLIAKTATFDNVNWSVQQIKDIVDYIVQAIKAI